MNASTTQPSDVGLLKGCGRDAVVRLLHDMDGRGYDVRWAADSGLN